MVTWTGACESEARRRGGVRLLRASDHESFGPGERDIARRRLVIIPDPQGAPRSGGRCAVHRLRKRGGIMARVVVRQRGPAQDGEGSEGGWPPAV